MKEEVAVSKDTYNKMVNVLAALPYAQIAQLLAEVGENTRVLEQTDKDIEGDGD